MIYITDMYDKEHAITVVRYELIKKVLNFLRYSEKSNMTVQNFISDFQIEFKEFSVGRFAIYSRSNTLYLEQMNDITFLHMSYYQYNSADEKGYIIIPIVKDKNGYVQFEDLVIGITNAGFGSDTCEMGEFFIRVHENKEFIESINEYIVKSTNKHNKHTEKSTSASTEGDSWDTTVAVIMIISSLLICLVGICGICVI